MDEGLQKYYEGLLEMFLTEGWSTFMEDMESVRDSITIEGLKSEEDFWKAKGKLEVLNRVLAFEGAMKAAYDEIVRLPVREDRISI